MRLTEAVGRRRPGLVYVRRAGEPVGELPDQTGLAAPEVPHGVAVAAVPLPPQRGEPAQVIAVGLADVPGLGHELYARDHRVLGHQVEKGGHVVEAALLAPEGGGQVEAEAVYRHVAHPVAQRVHDQLQGQRVGSVEGVAGPRRVEVVAGVAGHQAVVRRVVQPPETEGGTELAALGRVVEHHVEEHLEPGGVQGRHHGLELLHLPASLAGPGQRRVAVVGGEKTDRVVAPVVGEAPVGQERAREVLMDREQLEGGHPEVHQMGDGRFVAQAGVGPPQLGRHAGMGHREPLDVHLVDDGVGVAVLGAAMGAPGEGGVDHQAQRHVPGRVQPAGLVRVGHGVPGQLGAMAQLPPGGSGVRVKQELGRVAPQPPPWLIGPANAVAVGLARAYTRDKAVPNTGVVLQQWDLGLGSGRVEQAEHDPVGHRGGDGEVGPATARRGTERP